MPTLLELKNSLNDTREAWLKLYNDAPKKKLADGSEAPDLTTDQLKAMHDMRTEMEALGAQRDTLEKAARVAAEGWGDQTENDSKTFRPDAARGVAFRKSLSQQIEDVVREKGAGSFGQLLKSGAVELPEFYMFESKTTMTTSAGWAPEVLRDGDFVPYATRPVQVFDYLPRYTTNENAIKYMVESTYTSAAAAKDEAASYDEAAFAYTETTGIISKVGHYVPITEEELEDVPGLQSLISGRLTFGTMVEIDRMLTVGSGAAPVLRGLYNASSVQTAAYDGSTAGLETKINAIGTAMRKIQVTGYASPNLVLLHGTDLWTIAQTRDLQGRYILGDPGSSPMQTIWGVPIVRTEALSQGNGLVTDTAFCQVAVRKGITVEINMINDQFVKNLRTLKASARIGFKIRRGTANCRVTGL